MSDSFALDESTSLSHQSYRLVHDIYVVLDAGDRLVLSQYDLTSSQYRVLTLLDDQSGKRLTDLSDMLLCARSTITRLIDNLENRGLVHRRDDADDRRAQWVALTPIGIDLRERVIAVHERSLEQRLETLTPEEQNMLRIMLDKMLTSLRTDLNKR